MNDAFKESALSRVLGTYSRSLRQVRPSAALDARMAASIQENAGVRPVRAAWRRPLPWVVAAASVAAIVTGVALLVTRAAPPENTTAAHIISTHASDDPGAERAEPVLARNGSADRLAIPPGQLSLWPTEAAVFRVKASLGSNTQPVPGERQYWVDVRVANDGSMRIVRVLPANPED